jgi:hypothetical protein
MIKSRRMKWTGHAAYKFQVGKSEGERPLVKPRHMCEDNIKMDLREI